jgi:hypothetical protein
MGCENGASIMVMAWRPLLFEVRRLEPPRKDDRMKHAICGLWVLVAAVTVQAGQLYNAHPMEPVRAKWSPPRNAALQPVRIAGPRNGVYSAMVIYSDTLKTPAKLSDLTGRAGTIPASAIEIRYASRRHDLAGGPRALDGKDETFDALAARPDTSESITPVVLTAHIPADAKTGLYTGTLTVAGKKANVELMVADYLLPQPHHWALWCSTTQSPATLAVRYGVEPYSDEHFGLIEKSIALQGGLGDNVLYVPFIGKNLHGEEHGLVHFRQEGDGLKPDLTAFKRYLDLYIKHCEPPRVVILQVYDPYIGATIQPWHRRRGGAFLKKKMQKVEIGKHVWLSVIENGKLVSKKFKRPPERTTGWKDAIDAIKATLKDKGVKKSAMHFGVAWDHAANKEFVESLAKMSPGTTWALLTHGYGGRATYRGNFDWTDNNNAVVTYAEYPDPGTPDATSSGGNPEWPFVMLETVRDKHRSGSPAYVYRQVPSYTLAASRHRPVVGLARMGLDLWTLKKDLLGEHVGSRNRGVFTRYWWNQSNRLYRSATYSITSPGPEGALATLRYEMLREGMQEAETRFQMMLVARAASRAKALDEKFTKSKPHYERQRKSNDNEEYVEKLRQNLLKLQAQRDYYRTHAGREPSDAVKTRMKKTLEKWHEAMFAKGGDNPKPVFDNKWPQRVNEFYTTAAEVLGKKGPKTTVDLSKYRYTELRK